MKNEIKFLRRVSITEKFILYFLLVYIFAIGITSGTIFYSAKNALMSRTFEQMTSMKYVKKRQIENFFKDRIDNVNEIKFMIDNYNLNLYLKKNNPTPTLQASKEGARKNNPTPTLPAREGFKANACLTPSPVGRVGVGSNNFQSTMRVEVGSHEFNGIKDLIEKFIQSGNYFDGFIMNDENGKISSFSKFPERIINDRIIYDSVFNEMKNQQETFILDFSLNPATNLAEIYICKNIKVINKTNLMLILRLNTNSVNDIMLENNSKEGLGLTGESYLVGSDYLMRSKSRFIENSILKTKVETESVKKAFKNQSGTIFVNDYRNISVISSYIKLNQPDLNWVVLAEIDIDEAMIPVKEMLQTILILSIFISLIIFIITYYITIQITKPLKTLTNAALEIGQGNFSANLSIKYNDEIGDLTASFNLLSQTLLQKENELKNERLKRFSLVMDEQELEKERLSRELHDGLGQMFIALKLKLEAVDEGSEINMKLIEDFKNYLNDTIDEIRRISNNLMPSVLKEFGLITAVRNLCKMLNSLGKTNFSFETNLENDIADKKKKIYIYRIIQEISNNILKHSDANNASITLNNSKQIKLIIMDNGKGFSIDAALKSSGNGIYNMKERVLALKGEIHIETSSGNGTLIEINIPI
jgi:signal transduction histidine kinase